MGVFAEARDMTGQEYMMVWIEYYEFRIFRNNHKKNL